MRILLLFDIDTSGNGNPFGVQLLMSLASKNVVTSVQHGTCWLNRADLDYDVIHIHWPEALANWREPSLQHLKFIRSKLMELKKRSALVATVHNEYPHNYTSENYLKLFKIVYESADGIIHFGEESKVAINERYLSNNDNKVNKIIPHGDYSIFPNTVSKNKAKKFFNLDAHTSLLLSFGEIRSKKELSLIINSFKILNKKYKKLFVVGRLPNPLNSLKGNLNYLITRLPFYLNKEMFYYEKFIDPLQVQYYLNASDILFISKIKALNSGNVSLGFSFGKVVVGPNVGVIGEILKKTGNPVYNPNDINTVVKAIEKGFKLSAQGHGSNNSEYAKKNMQWDVIAKQHINFYKDLLKSK